MPSTFTRHELEAALLMWECMLVHTDRDPTDTMSHNEIALADVFRQLGSDAMRAHCARLAPWACAVWDALPEGVYDLRHRFDWLFILDLMTVHINWTQGHPLNRPAAGTAADMVKAAQAETAGPGNARANNSPPVAA